MKNIIITYGWAFLSTVLVCVGGSSLTADTARHVIEPDSPLTNALSHIARKISLQEDKDNKDHTRIHSLAEKGRSETYKFESNYYHLNPIR